ncbi:MAG: Fe-S cluster assembly protein HesB, partial [Actinomycetota bacterium]|nr:Fe-S cluster assembly protein HesB [Actinomycetota bacterium]
MPALPITGDPEADELLERDPFALLLGMLLDQQFPMERAFRGPYELKQRLGGRLDATELAGMDPEELAAVFARPPVVHRYPRSMAARTQALARY